MQVRRTTRDDWPAVARLRREWTEEQAGVVIDDPSYEDVFTAWAEREQHQRITWLALSDDDRAVGMLNLLVFTRMPRPVDPRRPGRPTCWGYVANVYVDRAQRDGGVGRLLLDACTAHADAEGFARLVLSPSERSVPFYARAGFEPATSLMVRPGPLVQ